MYSCLKKCIPAFLDVLPGASPTFCHCVSFPLCLLLSPSFAVYSILSLILSSSVVVYFILSLILSPSCAVGFILSLIIIVSIFCCVFHSLSVSICLHLSLCASFPSVICFSVSPLNRPCLSLRSPGSFHLWFQSARRENRPTEASLTAVMCELVTR